MKKRKRQDLFIHLLFVIYGLICVVPMLIVLSASFTSVKELSREGFSLFPQEFDLSAYAYLFKNPKQIIDGYIVTFFITIVGTLLSVMAMSLTAYALSRPQFKLKGVITFYIFFPTLFSGGLVSSYIINTKYLRLTDSLWVLILPGLINVFHVIILRTFFKELPASIYEAAKVDGASETRIYFSIAMRLAKPALATVAFLGAMTRWNEWYNAMLYIRTQEKYPLQYLLQRVMMNAQELIKRMNQVPSIVDANVPPGENLRMALLIVCIGPAMMFFPFFQKYFVKGMTVGSVKG